MILKNHHILGLNASFSYNIKIPGSLKQTLFLEM